MREYAHADITYERPAVNRAWIYAATRTPGTSSIRRLRRPRSVAGRQCFFAWLVACGNATEDTGGVSRAPSAEMGPEPSERQADRVPPAHASDESCGFRRQSHAPVFADGNCQSHYKCYPDGNCQSYYKCYPVLCTIVFELGPGMRWCH